MANKARRRPNHRLVKIHRSYSVEEIARLFGVHKNTVRAWIRQGLPLIDKRRPQLVQGADVVAYLKQRSTRNKRPCLAGQIYCVKCRAPKAPALDMADYTPLTETTGSLRGLCPDCESLIFRRVSRACLDQIRGNLDILFTQTDPHIADRSAPSVNCDFNPGATTDATQCAERADQAPVFHLPQGGQTPCRQLAG